MASSSLTTVQAAADKLIAVAGPGAKCLIALAIFALADPLLRSVFITFLQTLQAQIALQKTLLAAAVAQANVTLAIINAELGVFQAVTSITDGLGVRFPLDKLRGCPILDYGIDLVQGGVNSTILGSIPGVGNLSIPDIIIDAKNAVRKIRTMEAMLQQRITQMSQAINQLNLLNSQIQALIDFMNQIANFQGKLPNFF